MHNGLLKPLQELGRKALAVTAGRQSRPNSITRLVWSGGLMAIHCLVSLLDRMAFSLILMGRSMWATASLIRFGFFAR